VSYHVECIRLLFIGNIIVHNGMMLCSEMDKDENGQ